MTSLIVQTATRFVMPLLLLTSVFLLLRGHNEPGGGFVGGLMAASAFSLHAIAFDVAAARRLLRADPLHLVGAGLLVALLSGTISLGRPFMTGVWLKSDVAVFGRLELGSPMLFDLGVYLVVIGAALTFVFSLAEETGE